MSVEITVIDDRVDPGPWYRIPRYTGKMAAWTRIGEVYMTSAQTMVDAVLGAARGRKIGWLNILDHGNTQGIELGSDWITINNVARYQPILSRLHGHFTSGATVHLQHCQAGQNDALMMALARMWGAKVRAGRGNHNPVYRVNMSLSPYRICNGTSCWDERPPPPAEVDWNRKACCFPAGTGVWSPQGICRIEALGPGAKVWAREPATGRARVATVVALEEHAGSFALERLQIAGADDVAVTHDHRFASRTGSWIAAGQLRPSAALEAVHDVRPVTAHDRGATASHVFNLALDEAHGYFVGAAGLLVRDH